MSKIIGIVEKPTVIANAEGVRTTPSVVAFTKQERRRLVGESLLSVRRYQCEPLLLSSVICADYKVNIDGRSHSGESCNDPSS